MAQLKAWNWAQPRSSGKFFLKKTDFSKISEEEVYAAQENLNNRPRKELSYKTPNEVLAEVTGGAINT